MHGFSKTQNFLLNCRCLVEAKPSSLVSELVQARIQLLTHASHLCQSGFKVERAESCLHVLQYLRQCQTSSNNSRAAKRQPTCQQNPTGLRD